MSGLREVRQSLQELKSSTSFRSDRVGDLYFQKYSLSSNAGGDGNLRYQSFSCLYETERNLFNQKYPGHSPDSLTRGGPGRYSSMENWAGKEPGVGNFSDQKANNKTISGTEKFSQREITEPRSFLETILQQKITEPRNTSEIVQEVAEEVAEKHRILSKYVATLNTTFSERAQAVDKLIENVEKHLQVEGTNTTRDLTPIHTQIEAATSVKTELRNDLADLQKTKNRINGEIQTLYSNRVHTIAYYHGLRSEINQLINVKQKKYFTQRASVQKLFWQTAYESSIKNAESQIQKIDAVIGKTQSALEEATTKYNELQSLSEELQFLSKQERPAIRNAEEITTLVNDGSTKLVANLNTLDSAGEALKEIAETRRCLTGQVNDQSTLLSEQFAAIKRDVKTTSGQFGLAETRKTNLEKILGKFGQAREDLVSEINKLASMSHPIENYYELRSKIEKMRGGHVRSHALQQIEGFDTTWQQIHPIQEELRKQATSQLIEIDRSIEAANGALYQAREKYYGFTKLPEAWTPGEICKLLNKSKSKLEENGKTLQVIKNHDHLSELVKQLNELLAAPMRNGETTQEWFNSVKMRKINLEEILKKFNQDREDLVSEIHKLSSMIHPIEDYYKIESERYKSEIFNTFYIDEVDAYHEKWNALHNDGKNNLLKNAVKYIKKCDEHIERTKKVLNGATEMYYQLIDSLVPDTPQQQ